MYLFTCHNVSTGPHPDFILFKSVAESLQPMDGQVRVTAVVDKPSFVPSATL